MQKQQRETRRHKRFKWIRGSSTPCKQIKPRKGYAARFLTLLTFVFFTSCSLSPSLIIQNFNIEDTLSKVCLSQEGKGRVKERKRKVYFTYESLNDRQKQLYQLVMDIPLYGSEILFVDYSDSRNPVIRIEEDSMNKRKSLHHFMAFIKKFSKFIVLQQAIILNGAKGYCTGDEVSLSCTMAPGQDVFLIKKLNKMVRVTTRVAQGKALTFEFFDLKKNYFERVKAKYRNLQLDKSYFETDLFLGGCFDN